MNSELLEKLKIRVVSDVICPWCFIGKRRLEEALLEVGDAIPTEVHWSAFELNPDMPIEGLDRKAYRSAKFGSWAKSLEMDAQLSAVGAGVGIDFAFAKIERTPNTFAAHRLIRLAGTEGKQDAVVEELFRRYLVLGENIGDHEVLVAIAARCGVAMEAARGFLESDEGTAEVARESESARNSGISGVPTFIFNETYALSGAQPPAALVSAIRTAAEDPKVN